MASKPYRRGLIVGKFAPLHRGHECLIRTAQAKCENLVLVSYTRPEFASCSASLRENWLKSMAPDATVLAVDAPVIEQWRNEGLWKLPMPLNSDPADTHREFTAQLVAQKLKLKLDVVFTSEDYGDGFARYLNDHGIGDGAEVMHECVDIDRLANPVSGTSIRSSTDFSQAQLSESVMRDFRVKKICFLGGESTGKSTLSALMANEFNAPLVDEYGRTLWERNGGLLTQQDLITICRTQTANEDRAQQDAAEYIFCDTSPLTTLCYSDTLFNTRPALLEAFAERPYHQVFLCSPDFPFMQDGTRKTEAFRQWQNDWYLTELERRQIPFSRLSGTLEERALQIRRVIED